MMRRTPFILKKKASCNAIILKNGPASKNADPNLLAVAGGPSTWMQAFTHLTKNDKNSVVFFKPIDSYALWESSGRQISVREKVTKFINPWGVPKTLELKGINSSTPATFARLGRMGLQFAHERIFDTHHQKLVSDVRESFAAYEKVNAFLVNEAHEEPILRKTGRLVVAGEREFHDLYKHVFEWRKARNMVDTDNIGNAQDFLKRYSGLLFNEGYTGYGLQCGGFVVRDAEAILLRGLTKQFKGRFSTVDSTISAVTVCEGETGGFKIETAKSSSSSSACLKENNSNNNGGDEDASSSSSSESPSSSPKEVGQVYLSTGTSPIIHSSNPTARLCPPIEITGHSGVVVQKLSRATVEKILAKSAEDCAESTSSDSGSGSGGCRSLEEFFQRHPAAYMTDDFELTLERIIPVGDVGDGDGALIHWRVTGGAQINADFCRNDPMKSLVAHVRRFLADDDDDGGAVDGDNNAAAGVSVGEDGFHHCTRQVGPAVREQTIPLGGESKIVLNWGHLGVTLAGLNL